jgi:hypothetical protein
MMNYRNTEMKLDQLVNYLNEEKINLSRPSSVVMFGRCGRDGS